MPLKKVRVKPGVNREKNCYATEGCFYQAEDGIRDRDVTGVQTCALPIFTFKQVADFTIATGTDTYQGIYIDEWGELIMGRNALSVTRTAKRFIY